MRQGRRLTEEKTRLDPKVQAALHRDQHRGAVRVR